MTFLAIIQIIYLAINLFGLGVSIYFICGTTDDFPIVSKLFSFIARHFGKVAFIITGILLTILFLPTIALTAAFITFMWLWGTYWD